MTDYKLLTASSSKDLSELVVQCLSDGYTLSGSPGAIQGVQGGIIFYQAVAK